MVSLWIALVVAALAAVAGYGLGRRAATPAPTARLSDDPPAALAVALTAAPIAAPTARIEHAFQAEPGEQGEQSEDLVRWRNAIFAKVFNLVPDTLTITRASDGRYVEVNHNWESLTGYTREDALGHTSVELDIWVDLEQRNGLLAELKHRCVARDVDVTFRHKLGHYFYAKVSGNLFEAEGESYLMLAVKDVTAERAANIELHELNQQLEDRVAKRTLKLERANAELAEAMERLQRAKGDLVRSEKLAALGALVAGVAHELNTPIGNSLMVATTMEAQVAELAGRFEAGLRRSDLQSFLHDAKIATHVTVRNIERAAELVRSFKQVAVDRTSSQRRRFRLNELVAETALTLSPTIRHSGCELLNDVDEVIELDSYPGPLGQVLDNLITNALTHGYTDGAPGCIEVHAHPGAAADEVVIEVRDNGKGIPVDHLRRVFDPFFTTRLGQGGSGLGLHIVHNLVTDVLGGRIDVSSEPGTGAVFRMTLPLRSPESAVATIPI